MIKIIKDIEIYSPKYLGKKSIVIVNDKIEGVYDELEIPKNFINIEIIEGKDMYAFPGFIDAHVHLIGGGGEGGFKTRTPELQLSNLTRAGITTVNGCIGTDGVCRDMRALVAKVKALNEEGITATCYSGSYEIPVRTMIGSVKEDLMLVNEIIGVGEIALSDNRSSQPRLDQFINLVAESRVAGLLSNKSGIVNVHLGGGARRLNYLFEMLDETEIPATQVIPTHMNRTVELLDAGVEWIKRGGYIDLTTSSDLNNLEEGEMIASKALKYLLDKKLPIDRITFTSDGNGSMPLFDENGKLKELGICRVESLYEEVKKSILDEGIKIEDSLKTITSNVADLLKLKDKGRIEPKKDADIVIVNKEDLSINKVIAMGKVVIENGVPIITGTFEKSIKESFE